MSTWAQDELKDVLDGVYETIDVEGELKKAAPVDTGALRRSIRVDARGRTLEVRGLEYGAIQNARGLHEGWIERGLDEAVRKGNEGAGS